MSRLVVLLAVFLGCLATPGPSRAATLQMAWAQDATGLDPQKQTAFSSLRLLELVYEPLVRLDAKLRLVPAIASSWAFSDDGRTLTFQLDPKAKFHDGTPVTAADVRASFERILDQATGAVARTNFLSIAGIDTPDAEKVVFHLSEPDVPVLTAMADTNAAILPAGAIAAGTIGIAADGSGPFRLRSWEPNRQAILDANPDWAGGRPAIDGITIRVMANEAAILAALRAGHLDFAQINDPLVAELIDKDVALELNREPGLSYHVLQLNAARSPMTALAVRQAISCAVDRQQVLETASLGEGRVTGPLTIPAYASDPATLFCYHPDLARAERLLAEAGLAGGFPVTVIAASGESATAAAGVLQVQLARIGIRLKIQMLALGDYVDRWLDGDFDMALAENSGRADPYTMYDRYWAKTGNLQKVAHYSDDTLDSLLQQGRVAVDPLKRRAIFAVFEAHLAEMSPWVWLYTANTYTAQTLAVTGFVPTPTGSLFGLSKVRLAR